MSQSTLLAINGTDSRITVTDSEPLTATKYSIRVRANDINITDFEDNSPDQFGIPVTWENGVTGIRVADITWEGPYDQNDTPFVGIGIGLAQNVQIYISKTSSKYFNFSFIRILAINITTDVNGLTTYSVTAKSSGPFSVPT